MVDRKEEKRKLQIWKCRNYRSYQNRSNRNNSDPVTAGVFVLAGEEDYVTSIVAERKNKGPSKNCYKKYD